MSQSSPGPEVAIVIPCHRYGHFLAAAVRSAAAQTWDNLRIVIVDDGSPDETAAVARELIAELPRRRIDYLHQPNAGLAAARNAGIRATSSPFVLPLDADDRLAPLAVERLVRALEQQRADVATPLGRTFGDEDRPLVTLPVTRGRLLAGNCLVYASMFRRELFDRVGGYVGQLHGYEDWDLWLSALELGARFAHVPEQLFCYRRHGPTMLAAADRLALLLRARIVANHREIYPRWRVRLAERMLRAGDRPGLFVRLGMLTTLLCDRRLKMLWRQLGSLRTTNMLST